ncbi:cytochrome P460 family protein [Acidithiobacillus sp. AMEEHan]|uniref:cytochrome P460 family protein n=1 Tax=Acidithiobacillus sp. AMEEHan TaxID=2994951 RepID=UPI0027E584A0|nr:cytochrome P460 family protein [Acidithiobacillus sp. AMEEHan]
MKNILCLVAVVGISGAAIGPAMAGVETVPTPQALWQKIQVLQKNHAIMPESSPFQAGSRTVDAFTIDLANAAAVQSISQAGGIVHVTRYENGSLLVKENFNKNRKPTGVTAMLKFDGYDRADRNWVMAAYKPDGTLISFGKIGSCIACHTMVEKQDFVFAPPPQQLLSIRTWKAFFPKQEMNPAYVSLLKEHPEAIVR